MQKEKYKQPYKRVDLPKEKDYLHLDCPSCNEGIGASDININDKIAKCTSCNAVFSFQASIDNFTERKDPLKKPAGVDKIFFGDDMELSMQLPISVVEGLFLTLSPFIGFIGGMIYFKNGQMGGFIFMIVMMAIFTYFLVRVLRKKNRRVYFICQEDQLIVERENNKIVKDKVFNKSEIEQLYTTRTHNGYAVKVILNTPQGQVHKILIDYLKTSIDPKYIEQEIEEYYGIPNQKVATEI